MSGAAFVIGNGTNYNNRSDLFLISANGVASGKDFVTENGVSLSALTAGSSDPDLAEIKTLLQNKPSTGFFTIGCSAGTLVWVNMNA